MIQSYFQAEKQGGFIAMVIGIVACSVGGMVMLGAGAPFYTGFAIPLAVIGIIQLMVGATVARRSDLQADELEKLLGESPTEFRELEQPRMTKVMRNFVRYKWAELVCILAGLALILLNPVTTFSKGLGAGLFAQGIVLLVFDYFAEKRGREYAAFVNQQQA